MMVDYTFYNTTLENVSAVSFFEYIDTSTSFMFLPSLLLITFIVVFLSNKSKPTHGFLYSSFAVSILSILFFYTFSTFNVIFLYSSFFLLAIALGVILLFENEGR